MVSRRYQSLKFKYNNDFNEVTLKTQRAYYQNNDVNFATPVTNTFLSSVVFTDLITSSTVRNNMRRIELDYLNDDNTVSKLVCYLPYNFSDNPLLPLHIEEIKNSDNVICLDYYGDSTSFK